MTAQRSDIFIFKDNTYNLIGMEGGDLISPEQFGMNPKGFQSNNWRGFQAKYELTEETLYLRRLSVKEAENNYLPIEGILPKRSEIAFFRDNGCARYDNLSVIVTFTGKIWLAKEFIREFYVRMGYQKATAFETVLDITLKDGKMLKIVDRSKDVERKRGAFKQGYESKNIPERIVEAFSLDMELM